MDKEGLKHLTELGKKHGLSQDQLQEVIDLQFSQQAQSQQANAKARETTIKGWEKSLLNDPAIGNGNPEVLKSRIQEARNVLAAGEPTEGFMNFLKSGHGSNPDMVKFLLTIHSKMSEDSLVTRTTTSAPNANEGDLFERAGNAIFKNTPQGNTKG